MSTRIFDMFVQANGGGRRHHGGLGIGLALSRHLIEMHGGSISALSEGLGQGSGIYRAAAVVHRRAARHARTGGRGRGTARVRVRAPAPARVAPGTRAPRIDRGRQRRRGRQPVRAAAAFGSHSPDRLPRRRCVARDQPVSSRRGAARHRATRHQRLRGCAPRACPQNVGRCPILIALSGWGRAEDRELALEAGIEAHLTKPIDALSARAGARQRRPGFSQPRLIIAAACAAILAPPPRRAIMGR